jgi:hypothetical protein
MPSVKIASRQFNLPATRGLRIALGAVFVFFGLFGFLPILGFWMIPVGLLILSHDLSSVRRWRRRVFLWWGRRRTT